jgi:probable rRNA maturation factor
LTAVGPDLIVQYAVPSSGVPPQTFFEACVRKALPGVSGELVIRIVDAKESAALNEQYRGRSGPTNVLAFPAGPMPAGPALLGDIVICAPVVMSEADEQGKPTEAHWAHIVIHGCLHLAGFDHMADPDAEEMEARERELLADLGIADPYPGER